MSVGMARMRASTADRPSPACRHRASNSRLQFQELGGLLGRNRPRLQKFNLGSRRRIDLGNTFRLLFVNFILDIVIISTVLGLYSCNMLVCFVDIIIELI